MLFNSPGRVVVERMDTLKRLRELKLIKKFITRFGFWFFLNSMPFKTQLPYNGTRMTGNDYLQTNTITIWDV